MAFSARGWRKIVLGDQLFFWQRGEWVELFRVRPDRESHLLLRVVAGGCGRGGGFSGGAVPGVVREAVECALSHGWPAGLPNLRLFAFDDPVRFVGLQTRWVASPVQPLAQGIYAERAFDRMPILADALEEAGCDDPDILTHCRSEQPHGQGCWVIGLLLGRH